MSPANAMADTAIISAILVKGVLQCTSVKRSTAVINEPTKLIATKNTKLEIYIPQDA